MHEESAYIRGMHLWVLLKSSLNLHNCQDYCCARRMCTNRQVHLIPYWEPNIVGVMKTFPNDSHGCWIRQQIVNSCTIYAHGDGSDDSIIPTLPPSTPPPPPPSYNQQCLCHYSTTAYFHATPISIPPKA